MPSDEPNPDAAEPFPDEPTGGAPELSVQLYAELHRLAEAQLARERRGHTLQPTALLHEAWLRLSGREGLAFASRGDYLALFASVMRAVLVDHARRRAALKRDAGRERISLDGVLQTDGGGGIDVLELDSALERLSSIDRELATLVEQRFFGGLGREELCAVTGLAPRTLDRRWRAASAWLRKELAPG